MISSIKSINNQDTFVSQNGKRSVYFGSTKSDEKDQLVINSKTEKPKSGIKKLLSNGYFQLASIGTGIAGIIYSIKTRKMVDQWDTKLVGVLNTLGEEIPICKKLTKKISGMIDLLAKNATIEDLTGLWNSKTFKVALNKEVEAARKSGNSLCVGVLDMDYFKSINDTFGHDVGDTFLKQISQEIMNAIKDNPNITAHRYGGEEFGLIFRNMNEKAAKEILQDISKRIYDNKILIAHKDKYLQILDAKIRAIKINNSNAEKLLNEFNELKAILEREKQRLYPKENLDKLEGHLDKDLSNRIRKFSHDLAELFEKAKSDPVSRSYAEDLRNNPTSLKFFKENYQGIPKNNGVNLPPFLEQVKELTYGNRELNQYADWYDHVKKHNTFTISAGMARFNPEIVNDSKAFFKQADDALYLAKEGGRNAIKIS